MDLQQEQLRARYQDDSDVLRKQAYYVIKGGGIGCIHAKDLWDPVVCQDAISRELFEGGTRRKLCFKPEATKDGVKVKAHFAYTTPPDPEECDVWDKREELDSRHNERLYFLLFNLRSHRKIEFSDDKNNIVAVADAYRWTHETQRIMSLGGCVRHDIFGASASHRMSRKSPVIAIEVVLTHWPIQKSLDDMVCWTTLTPSIVIFDLASKPNLLLSPPREDSPLQRPPEKWCEKVGDDFEIPRQGVLRLRSRCYIREGALFRYGSPVPSVAEMTPSNSGGRLPNAQRLSADLLEAYIKKSAKL